MERINQFRFYELGQTFKAFGRLDGSPHPTSCMFEIMEADRLISDLLSGNPITLGFSKQSAAYLQSEISGIISDHFTYSDENGARHLKFPDKDDPVIPGWRLAMAKQKLERFETVLGEELAGAAAYVVPTRGIYDTPLLVDSADQTFPDATLPQLPDKARSEWKSAGRCLAFSLLSASGFHVARAIEAMLEIYYPKFTGRSLPEGRSWGHHVSDLENINGDKKPSDKTLSMLRQIKDDYRNPLMHPRVVLTESDARMLFSSGESLIIAMADEIRRVDESGIQPTLADMFNADVA